MRFVEISKAVAQMIKQRAGQQAGSGAIGPVAGIAGPGLRMEQ